MSERRKKRKRAISSSSSLIPEQPDSPRGDLSISSQVTEDESSIEDPLNAFFHELFQSESTAARVAPYHEQTPSGSLGGTESTSPTADSVACDRPKFIPPSYPLFPDDPWRSSLASYPLQKKLSSPRCSVRPLLFVKSEPSPNEPLSFTTQGWLTEEPSSFSVCEEAVKTQSAPLRETDSTASSVSMKSDSSMYEPPSFNLQKKQSEPLRETDSTVSHVSMKSDSSMYEPPSFNLQKKQSEPLRETDSTVSHVSMKSDSSMYEPPSFKLKKIQSCSVCEEDVMDPILLLCGHWACKRCVCSFWYQYSSTADYPCKKCGKRFRGHQTDTEDDNKNLNLPSAPQPAPEDTTEPVRREKRDQVLQSILLEQTIKKVEMETEKLELEKRKLALEIQILEQKGKYTI